MVDADGRAVLSRWPWLRSPWLPTVLAVVPTVLTAWAASPPGGYFDIALLAIGGWLVAGASWLAVAVLITVVRLRPHPIHVRTRWPLLTFPALLVGIFLLAGSGMLNRAAFEMHRPGLERLVADVAAEPDQRLVDQRVGLFAVPSANVRRTTGCTTITIRDAGFFDSRGYAYCLGQPPVDKLRGSEGTTYEHIDGSWYTVSFVW